MGDGFWSRQPPLYPSASMPKRSRQDFDFPPGAPSGQEMLHYMPRDDDHAGFHALKDSKSIGASYDRYLQNQMTSLGSGEVSKFSGGGIERGSGSGMPGLGGGMQSLPFGDRTMMGGPIPGAVHPDMAANRGMGFTVQLHDPPMVRQAPPVREMPLPHNASNTLFVEGLPRDCTRREVAHIFRPFLGFKEVRIVTKESKQKGGDPLVLCFVDFTSAVCAMTAMNALQGYKMDEHEPDSPELLLKFSLYPGPRSGNKSRSKR